METSASSYLQGGSTDSGEASKAQILMGYRGQIEDIRDLFRFEIDLREITPGNINDLEKSLRDILKEISHLERKTDITDILTSSDAIQKWIEKAIDNLYVVSYILQSEKVTINERYKLHQMLRECHRFLSEALEYFLV